MSGEAEEFREFVELRSNALLRTACLLAGGDPRAGEDLLQDALVEVYRRWRRIKEKDAREAYTRRILVRMATRQWKRRTSQDQLPDVLAERAADAQGDSDAALDMRGYLTSLPPKQRAVLVLRYYEDLSEAQTAALLECPTGTVKSRASAGLQTLRDLIRAADGVPATSKEQSKP